jgi:hypothetical protein
MILLLLLLQLTPPARTVAKPHAYVLTAAQTARLSAKQAAIKAAMAAHNSEQFSRAHRAWWDECQKVKAELKAPVTAVCEADNSVHD